MGEIERRSVELKSGKVKRRSFRCIYVLLATLSHYSGKTGELEKELNHLCEMVIAAGGSTPRILHTHFASLGAPDAVFEQEAIGLSALETQISKLTESPEFQSWSHRVSSLLTQSPRSLYHADLIIGRDSRARSTTPAREHTARYFSFLPGSSA